MKQTRVRASADWRHETFAASETQRDTEYEIVRHRTERNLLRCACMAYVFNKDVPKRCKHIDAYRAGGDTALMLSVTRAERLARKAAAPVEAVAHVVAAGEAFTFRRAMSFAGVPGVAR